MLFLKPKPDTYPPYFYKYIPFEKKKFIEDILLHNRLYFSLPKEFKENDAYDCRAYNFVVRSRADRSALIEEEIRVKHPNFSRLERRKMLRANMKKYQNADSAFYKDRMESMNRIFKDGSNVSRIAILCLTDSEKRPEMWNSYIPSNQGVCIRLNGPMIVKHLWNTEISSSHINPHLNWLRNVEYVLAPVEIPWAAFFKAEPLSAGTTQLYTKLDDFSFEQEWRFTIYECIEQSIPFPESIIEEVFVAPGTTAVQRKTIDEWNSSRNSPFKVSEAHIGALVRR